MYIKEMEKFMLCIKIAPAANFLEKKKYKRGINRNEFSYSITPTLYTQQYLGIYSKPLD